MTSSDRDELVTMVNDCQARERRMSEWERSFMDSIELWLGKANDLSPRQIETLHRIWEKVTA